MNSKERIAKAAVSELLEGSVINLGIGIPTLIPRYLPNDAYYIHTENGLLGVAELDENSIDVERVNAGKLPVGESIGASYFGSSSSFAMIRGGHIDIAVLGALQIDQSGKIANWSIPGKSILGVGGAMDLLTGAKKIIVTTTHLANDGTSKFLKECSYPITSNRIVDVLITDKAIFRWKNNQYELSKIYSDVTIEEIVNHTEAYFAIPSNVEIIEVKENGE